MINPTLSPSYSEDTRDCIDRAARLRPVIEKFKIDIRAAFYDLRSECQFNANILGEDPADFAADCLIDKLEELLGDALPISVSDELRYLDRVCNPTRGKQ